MRLGACLGVLRLPRPPILEPSFVLVFFVFFGVIFWNPVCSENLIFAMKNQHFEVHFGTQKQTPAGTHFFKIFVIFGFIFGDPVCSENLVFYQGNSRFLGPFWAPERGPPETHFFMFFCSLQETDDGSDDKVLDLSFTVISKTSVSPRQN